MTSAGRRKPMDGALALTYRPVKNRPQMNLRPLAGLALGKGCGGWQGWREGLIDGAGHFHLRFHCPFHWRFPIRSTRSGASPDAGPHCGLSGLPTSLRTFGSGHWFAHQAIRRAVREATGRVARLATLGGRVMAGIPHSIAACGLRALPTYLRASKGLRTSISLAPFASAQSLPPPRWLRNASPRYRSHLRRASIGTAHFRDSLLCRGRDRMSGSQFTWRVKSGTGVCRKIRTRRSELRLPAPWRAVIGFMDGRRPR
jgi:hypothetical protein